MMWVSRTNEPLDRRLFMLLLGALVVLAWIALWAWGQSPYGRYLSHHSVQEVRGQVLLAPIFLAGWTLMVVAMMLPTSLPLVTMFHTLTQRRPGRHRLLTLLLAGYLIIWTGFGLLVYLGDWLIHLAVEQNRWLEAHAGTLGATTLIVSGLYQFSPLKYFCLDQCRSPLSFITSHWQGRHENRQALWLGMHHGIFCLGCCWSLMLVMFAIGVGSLGWMFALGVVMAVEKNVPWGRRLSAPLGFGLIGSGLAATLAALL